MFVFLSLFNHPIFSDFHFHPGFVLIDRDGKHFGTILNYLRDGTFRMPALKQEIHELLVSHFFLNLRSVLIL